MPQTGPILARLDDERRNLLRSGETIEQFPEVTRLAIGEHRMISWSRLSDANVETVIAREIAHHRALGAAFEWKVYAHDTPADLVARLARHGLAVGPCEAVMIYDLAHLPDWMAEMPGVRVERLTRAEQLSDFRTVLVDVFGEANDATIAALADALASGSREHLGYVAYADDEPASVGRLYTHPQSAFGGLYGGSTRAKFRGRGLYRALVAARARDAMELGAKYLLVDALPTSRPILERLGFAHLTDTWPCECSPA